MLGQLSHTLKPVLAAHSGTAAAGENGADTRDLADKVSDRAITLGTTRRGSPRQEDRLPDSGPPTAGQGDTATRVDHEAVEPIHDAAPLITQSVH